MNIGWERKIGYSFVGLMAGNVASLATLLIIASLPKLHIWSSIGQFWKLNSDQAIGAAVLFGMFSMPAWIIVGLPFVLLIRSDIIAEFYWITAALIGAVLGLVAMFLITLVFTQGHVAVAEFQNVETLRLFAAAGLIAGVAFAVYCALVQAALRRQAKKSGAPSGTSRSIPWFEIEDIFGIIVPRRDPPSMMATLVPSSGHFIQWRLCGADLSCVDRVLFLRYALPRSSDKNRPGVAQ